MDKPGVAPGGDQHFTSSTLAGTPILLPSTGQRLLQCIKYGRAERRQGMSIEMIFRFLLLLTCALPAGAATVRMAFGDNLPPYILVSSSSGIEIDIVREAPNYRGGM